MEKSENEVVPVKGFRGLLSIILIIAGIVINLVCAVIADKIGTPLFLDTIGTILISVLGGYLPGITVALVTNLCKGMMEFNSIYYGILNILIAICTCYVSNRRYLKRISVMILYTMIIALIGGGFGAILTWYLEGFDIAGRYSVYIKYFYESCHFGKFQAQFLAQFLVDLIDKVLSVTVVLLILKVIPDNVRKALTISGWRQRPLYGDERKAAEGAKCRKISLKTKIVLMLVFASFSLATLATWISLMLFEKYTKTQHIELAEGIAKLAAGVIDTDRVEDFIEKGEDADGYTETEELLYKIRESSPDIEYVYVYKIEEDGCHVVFDLDTEDLEGSEPGEIVPFDEAFYPYLPALMAGEKIKPIISDDTFGWLLTVYQPVYNEAGQCVCYAAADVAMKDLREYEQDFFIKMSTLFTGFFVLILAIGLWLAEYNIILPVNSMAFSASAFAYNSDTAREENVERIRNLDIITGDEVENLYNALLKTTEDSMFYVEELQEKNETISEMQKGLIMVLADMVENRDASTGDHVRKTAAYTEIIMKSLRKKDYYTEVLTDKFISDVVQSAPLHDIGKITIPDAVLNKTGKLTDEEFEIMKTHTTAGKKMIEEAIQNVKGAAYLAEAKNLAAYHHEKWNGCGYPSGLSGEEIPLSARVMAVADVFDALVSKRCYKEPFSFEKAMSIIKESAGSHFDPKVVEAFVSAGEEVRQVAENFDKMRKNV